MQRIIGWAAAALVVTVVFGTMYVCLQQVIRHSANMAPAAAAAAQVQEMPSATPNTPRLELTPDSGVFVIVYGRDNSPVTSSVTLHGVVPSLPGGVLDAARASGSDAVTWQPEPGLRFAVVARPAAGKVVVAGQSLAPFEDNSDRTLLFLAAGWLGSMIVLIAAYLATALAGRRKGPAA
ncbi:hypothetical protein J7I84_16970 [Arthrobacter sp. ISL-85]|uniref:hypothetical protein n=1 Tax=Arthrobacter sp. ISL-85 TaxID=2819115 RepID=UPI001BE5C84B|nr:hypothetical protein [Arthrobacter sp. ISL-85]MBT2568161.1 hypothetical protein [Arthrobacter sp. ISL-85]